MATPSDDILDLLTAYALDALEPQEMARVSELLQSDPELRGLLADLRATAGQLPYALPEVELPAGLRQKVLDRSVGRTTRTTDPARSTRAAQPLRRWLAGLGTLAAAGLVAAVLAFTQLSSVRGELERTRAELEQQVALNREVADVIADNPETVALRGDAGSATVLRDANGQLVLAANLPALEEGRVYQLWLVADGTPVSGGTFTVDQQGRGLAILPQTEIPSGVVFAVTEEPGPSGSETPTLPPLIAS